MLHIGKIIGKFLKDSSQKELGLLKSTVAKINSLEAQVKEVPNEKFATKTQLGLL